MWRLTTSMLAVMLMAIILTTNGALLADQANERLLASSGCLIPPSSQIFVGEVKSVSWDINGKVAGRAGKATFVIREAIRGGKKGDDVILPVQEIRIGATVHGGNFVWQGLQFKEGSLWLIFVGKEHIVTDLAQIKSVDDPIVKDTAKAAEIDSQKPEDKLKALQGVLGEKSLKPVLLVNYGVEAVGALVRTHPQACSVLLSVATESSNPHAIRAAALDAIARNLADGRQEDERPTWAEELKMLLETAPKVKGSPVDLLNQYATVLSQAVQMGSWEKTIVIPPDVKLESPDKVKEGLASISAGLDKSIHDLKEKLADAKVPTTTFPAESQREQRIADLQASIEATEKLSEFLKTLATSAASQPASVPAGD